MPMAKKQTTTTTTTEFRTQLVDFRSEVVDFKGKKVLELVFTNEDLNTWKKFNYSKYFWILNSENLDFSIFKAERAFANAEPEFKSFQIYGEKWLIKSLQEAGKITAEL